jgi:hypothetical protein
MYEINAGHDRIKNGCRAFGILYFNVVSRAEAIQAEMHDFVPALCISAFGYKLGSLKGKEF